MLEAKVLWVVDHDFEHEGFSCGGVICDAFASAVLGGVWFVFSNNHFQFLNNISRISTHFFTHTYFHKYFQTTIFSF